MKTHARVVVIGGGVMGVSLIYHLTKLGWTDVVLVEKNDLTHGSTWHAAGLCTHYSHNPTIMEMRATSVRMYRDTLEEETGLSTGFHPSGALRVTRSADRMDEFRHVQGLGNFVGYDFHILSPGELKEIYPLCKTDGLLGAIYEPQDGHVDPTLATNAMAKGARSRGAEIYRYNQVNGISRSSSGEWIVATKNGDIRAEHIVNAAGTWCREIGDMMGVDLPVVPMLHQYVVTDTIPEVAELIESGAKELPIIRDPEESWYLRQERDGMIIGPYERDGTPWSIDGVPPEFGADLLPPDLDKIEDIMVKAMERVPALGNGGLKTVVNGPITFTPDANPLIGPAFSLPNAWLLTGSSMGVMEGGGAGSFLASWMVSGSPPSDAWAIDARRFGNYADRDYRLDKSIECFGLQFGVHYPFEEREAGRTRRVTPIYEDQKKLGAVFGCAYGWERPNWYSLNDAREESKLTFRRPGWFDCVAAECRAVQNSVGVADLSAFSKFDIIGKNASDFVEKLGANRPPQKTDRMGLTHALTPAGGVMSEFTITKLGEECFYLTSAAFAERHDEDLLRNHAANFDHVEITNNTEQMGILGLMGPHSRDVLSAITSTNLDNESFPWLSAQEIQVTGINVRALRVSYVGELGWELHMPLSEMKPVFDALMKAGEAYGLRPFGTFAMNAMRLEKGYRAMGSEFTTERTPSESGVGFLVKTEGREFQGRNVMIDRDSKDTAWRMELLELDAASDAAPYYSHAVIQNGAPVGIVTSAAYGHRTDKMLAFAYLRPEARGDAFEVKVLNQTVPCRVLKNPPYDPDNLRLKSIEGIDNER